MKCPSCSHEFGVPEGVTVVVKRTGIASSDLEISVSDSNPKASLLSDPRARVRGPNKDYSGAFEAAWKQYGRKQEKEESFFRWRIVAPSVGGEETLLRLCLAAFRWQAIEWGPEGWKFAPYFHRYLKRRKWEDEAPPMPQAVPRHIDDRAAKSTDTVIERYRAAQARTATPDELAKLRASRG